MAALRTVVGLAGLSCLVGASFVLALWAGLATLGVALLIVQKVMGE